jgi:hypothetical protein
MKKRKEKKLYVLQPHNQQIIVMRVVPKGGFKWTGILFYERHPVMI